MTPIPVAELTIGSLFSGIGGLELGLERAGLGPVIWQVEIDPFVGRYWPGIGQA
jgi:DNA (cytosine-5)-methyltransferase 1